MYLVVFDLLSCESTRTCVGSRTTTAAGCCSSSCRTIPAGGSSSRPPPLRRSGRSFLPQQVDHVAPLDVVTADHHVVDSELFKGALLASTSSPAALEAEAARKADEDSPEVAAVYAQLAIAAALDRVAEAINRNAS